MYMRETRWRNCSNTTDGYLALAHRERCRVGLPGTTIGIPPVP
jgi:hypothetical protein